MALSLRIPRVEVFWGDTNLTFYQGKGESDPLYGEPLVYNVSVSLSENGQNPSGTMNWSPTGAAYKIYEDLVTNFADRIITTRFYYLDGRSITFSFVWAGHQENYGNNMDIKVYLNSELDGLTNGIIRSTAQADEKGVSMSSSIKELEKFYGVEKYNLIEFTEKAKKDLEKVKVQSNYGNNSKFYEAVSNLAENNGNIVFSSNIASSKDPGQSASKCIFFTPYAWDKDSEVAELSPAEQFPNAKVRNGFFLGPCLIDTISKQSQWQPPQKKQVVTLNQTPKIQPKTSTGSGTPAAAAPAGSGTATAVAPTIATGTPQQVVSTGAVRAARTNASNQPGATGSSRSASRSRARLAENKDGEEKKLLIEKQHQCKLSATLFMAPAFTGIKPHDVLFIPNFSGTYMEDWVVTTVEYTQTDGGVNLSVQASRHFGLAEFMNAKQGKIWQDKALSYGLVGDKGTLENWMAYGWKVGTTGAASTSVTGGAASQTGLNPPAPPAPAPGTQQVTPSSTSISPPGVTVPLEVVPYSEPTSTGGTPATTLRYNEGDRLALW